MSLSNTLFTTVSNKLKLKISLLNEERFLIKNLKSQADTLRKVKESNNKYLNQKEYSSKSKTTQNLLVAYIINISFLKANTTVHVSDIKGNVKLFYSAGSVNLMGKQKRKRRIAISKLISLLLKKATFLTTKPIALHLNNVNSYKSFIVGRLKKTLYIRVIKSFNQAPYNGCRKKKLRRKKYTKRFK